jgi:hypothetical protein
MALTREELETQIKSLMKRVEHTGELYTYWQHEELPVDHSDALNQQSDTKEGDGATPD